MTHQRATRPVRCLLGSILMLISGVILGCTGCSDGTTDGSGDRAGHRTMRPGDSLLDHLAAARITAYPECSLPPELAAIAGGSIRVRAPISPLAWERVLTMPANWEPILAANGHEELYWAVSPLPLLEGAALPLPLIDGEPAPVWDMGSGATMPERLAIWRPVEQLLLATGVPGDLLRDVGIEGSVGGLTEFGLVDRGSIVTGREPAPADLRTQKELGNVVRSGQLLAAPGSIQWTIAESLVERLEFSVGVADEGWSLVDGVVRRVRGRSDGATFVVEVRGEGDASATRVWEHTVGAEDVGTSWVDGSVDLTPWRGRSCTVSLITEGGPAGDTLFDYCLWAGLRLRGGETRTPGRPHVVILDVDTLRADRLGSMGGQAGLTPELDAWAARSAIAFPDSVATAPWTLPSTASMFTGLSVHQHGIDLASDALGAETETIVTLLAEAGYETRGIATGGYLRPAYGFHRGFDVYETRDPKDIDWSDALDFVRSRGSERPLFMFLHTYYVHAPYEYEAGDVDPAYDGVLHGVDVDRDTVFDPWHDQSLELTEADRRYVEDLYDGLVRRMDSIVGRFIMDLEDAIGDEPLLLILTSDHGEAFLEHGLYGHGLALWGEVLRVPLLIRFPDGQPGTSDAPASGVDLLPTILHAVGLPVPDGLPGRPLQTASGPSVRVAQYQADLRSVQSGGYKLIEPWTGTGTGREGAVRLYQLSSDVEEQHDLAAGDVERVEQLRRRLEWFLATYPERGDEPASSAADSAAIDELRELGYLGGR